MHLLVIDEHPVVRRGLRSILEQEFEGSTVAESDSLDAALDDGGGRPDLVILDPRRGPGEVGQAIARLDKGLGAPIVVFTANGGARVLSEALKAGVKGYVRKDSPSADLLRAIHAAAAGAFYVDPALASTIVLDEGERTLTPRQREILQMLADGMQTRAVALKLGLSNETIRTHTKRILARLEAGTRTEAVAIGIRNGFIE